MPKSAPSFSKHIAILSLLLAIVSIAFIYQTSKKSPKTSLEKTSVATKTTYALSRRDAKQRGPNFNGYVIESERSQDAYPTLETQRLDVVWSTTSSPADPSLFYSLDTYTKLNTKDQSNVRDYLSDLSITSLGKVNTEGIYKNWNIYAFHVLADRGYSYQDTTYDILVSPDRTQAIAIDPIISYDHATNQFKKDLLVSNKDSLDPWGILPLKHDVEIKYAFLQEDFARNLGRVDASAVRVVNNQEFNYQDLRFPECHPKMPCGRLNENYQIATTTQTGYIIYKNTYDHFSDRANLYYVISNDGFLVSVTGGDILTFSSNWNELLTHADEQSITYIPNGLCNNWPSTSATGTDAFVKAEGNKLKELNISDQMTVHTFALEKDAYDLNKINISVNTDIGGLYFGKGSLTPTIFFAKNLMGHWTLYSREEYCRSQ